MEQFKTAREADTGPAKPKAPPTRKRPPKTFPRAPVRDEKKAPPTLIEVGGTVMEWPNPNNLTQELHEALAIAVHRTQVAALCQDLMGAEREYYDRHRERHAVPDNQIRLAALRDYMDRVQGWPVERQMIITNEKPASLEDLMEKAKKLPVFRKTLADMLKAMDAA